MPKKNPLPWILCLSFLLVATSCVGSDDDDEESETLSPEDYFQQLEQITGDAEEATNEAEDFELVNSIVLAAIEQIEALRPPDEARDEHDAYVEALNDYAPLVLDFVEESEDLSLEEIQELDTGEIDDALAEIDEACNALQSVADDEGIDSDLECDGPDDEDEADADPPGNDDRSAATAIEDLPFSETVNVEGATIEGGEPQPSCGGIGENSASVWYEFIAEGDVSVITIGTAGSDYDTVVAVYESSDDSNELACNDDDAGGSTSSLSLRATEGDSLLIQVAAYGSSDAGTLEIEVREREVAGENDEFDTATVVDSLPFSESLDTSLYTTTGADPKPMCGFSGNSANAWYELAVDEDSTIVVDTAGSSYDTVVIIYEETPDGLNELTCNDDSDVDSIAALSFVARAGVTYYIEVAAYGDDGGGGLQLAITEG